MPLSVVAQFDPGWVPEEFPILLYRIASLVPAADRIELQPKEVRFHHEEPFTLGKAKIRGVESQGMICAAFELGLTKEPGDKPEIMILKSITGTIIAC